MRGYIYILINPSLQGLLKIGKTTRSPEERVRELSMATNMPTSFILAYQQNVSDCDTVERMVHEELTDKGYRVADNREFFELPLHEAVSVVFSVASRFKDSEVEDFDDTDEEDNSGYEEESLGFPYYSKGLDFFYGMNGELQDYKLAADYFKKAVDLGESRAYFFLARIYLYGGVRLKKSVSKAFDYADLAKKYGHFHIYLYLADFYQKSYEPFNEIRAISLYVDCRIEEKESGKFAPTLESSFEIKSYLEKIQMGKNGPYGCGIYNGTTEYSEYDVEFMVKELCLCLSCCLFCTQKNILYPDTYFGRISNFADWEGIIEQIKSTFSIIFRLYGVKEAKRYFSIYIEESKDRIDDDLWLEILDAAGMQEES